MLSNGSGGRPDTDPLGILHKSIAGRYWPVRVADRPITVRYRFIKNTSWGDPDKSSPMLRLIRNCFVRICDKDHFRMLRPNSDLSELSS